MSLCPDPDLNEKKEKHIRIQTEVVKRLRQRLNDLENIENKTDRELTAYKKLRMYLNGESEDPDNPGQFIKNKNTAEDRLKLIEAIYNRPAYHFKHKYKDGEKDKDRYSDIFGLPSLKELYEKNPKLAFDLIARTLSLIQSNDSTRNPYDYLDTENNDVKIGKYGSAEHHHIYNNVALTEEGKVQVKSVSFNFDEDKGVSLRIIPAYHGTNYDDNKTENMDAIQYIALQSELHSGNDPVTHLYYYEFDEKESENVLSIAKNKLKEEQLKMPKKIEALKNDIGKYEKRLNDPSEYEKELIKNRNQMLADNPDLDQKVLKDNRLRDIKSKFIKDYSSSMTDEENQLLSIGQKSILTQEQLDIIKKYNTNQNINNQLDDHYKNYPIKNQLNQIEKDLEEHQADMNTGSEIKKLEKQIKGIEDKLIQVKEKAKVTERTIKDWIRSYLRGKPLPPEKQKIAKQFLQLDTLRASKNIDKTNLENKSSVLQLLQKKQQQLKESETIMNLDDNKTEELFNQENGYYSFDKGHYEGQQHSKLTNAMNKEITYNLAREAIAFLEEKGLSVDDILKQQYSTNLQSTISYSVDILNRQKQERDED